MHLKKIEKKFSWKPIVYCTALNLLAAGSVFAASFLAMGFGLPAVFYTLATWTITVTLSFVFWTYWFLKKNKRLPSKIRFGFVAMMLALLALDWAIILSVLAALGVF